MKNYATQKKENCWKRKNIEVKGRLTYLSLIASLFMMLACDKEDVQPVELVDVKGFFPLELGQKWIYDVEEINIDSDVDVFDTLHYQQKLELNSFDSSLQQYVLTRFVREDSLAIWTELDHDLCYWDEDQFLYLEDNLRYLKMIDPARSGMQWDGNIYSILPSSNYQYSDLNATFEVDSSVFSTTLKVEKGLIDNVILYRNGYEVFAKDVGSVYSIWSDFERVNGVNNKGSSKELKLIKYIE